MPQLHREFSKALTLDEVLVDRIDHDFTIYQGLKVDQPLGLFREGTPVGSLVWRALLVKPLASL